MTERRTVIVVLVVVAAAISLGGLSLAATGNVVSALSADTTPATTSQVNDSGNESLGPGAHFSGVVGSQQAEIEGEVESRAFGISVAKAATNHSKAAVVADRLSTVRERLADLGERQRDLRAAKQNGSLSDAAFAVQMTEIVTRAQTMKRLVNQSEAVSRDLPTSVLAEQGVDVEAIQTLKLDAHNLSGQNVSALARSIAGDRIGASFTPPGLNSSVPGSPPDGDSADDTGLPDQARGVPDDSENTTERGNGPDSVGGSEEPIDTVTDPDETTTDPTDNVTGPGENTTDPVDNSSNSLENVTDRLTTATRGDEKAGDVTVPIETMAPDSERQSAPRRLV